MNDKLFQLTIQTRVSVDSYLEASQLADLLADTVEDKIIEFLDLSPDCDLDITAEAEEVKE